MAKNIIKYAALSVNILLVACATPETILTNKSGDHVVCGGSSVGSLAGGIIGYHIQKSNDEDCVQRYKSLGYDTNLPNSKQ